ncbi:hypothetical protein OIU76_006750 [Salix suchowensis]|nr:hypothetical protein OIU76_006750 [Salix suchowensis]
MFRFWARNEKKRVHLCYGFFLSRFRLPLGFSICPSRGIPLCGGERMDQSCFRMWASLVVRHTCCWKKEIK